MSEVYQDKVSIQVGEHQVCLDRLNLKFNEGTLSEYLETEAGWIDYFGAKLAEAEEELSLAEHGYEKIYAVKFSELKPSGSDKYVEALVKCDDVVDKARRFVIGKKRNVRLLQQHLRAWDKNHENAQSRGHFLRKEMDRLNKDTIKCDNYLERKVNENIEEIDINSIDFNNQFPA